MGTRSEHSYHYYNYFHIQIYCIKAGGSQLLHIYVYITKLGFSLMVIICTMQSTLVIFTTCICKQGHDLLKHSGRLLQPTH